MSEIKHYTEEEIAQAHRDATWSAHLLQAMKMSREFHDLAVEHLHAQMMIEMENYGIDPEQPPVVSTPSTDPPSVSMNAGNIDIAIRQLRDAFVNGACARDDEGAEMTVEDWEQRAIEEYPDSASPAPAMPEWVKQNLKLYCPKAGDASVDSVAATMAWLADRVAQLEREKSEAQESAEYYESDRDKMLDGIVAMTKERDEWMQRACIAEERLSTPAPTDQTLDELLNELVVLYVQLDARDNLYCECLGRIHAHVAKLVHEERGKAVAYLSYQSAFQLAEAERLRGKSERDWMYHEAKGAWMKLGSASDDISIGAHLRPLPARGQE